CGKCRCRECELSSLWRFVLRKSASFSCLFLGWWSGTVSLDLILLSYPTPLGGVNTWWPFSEESFSLSARARAVKAAHLIRPDQPHSLHGAGGLGHVQSFGLVLSFYTGLSYNSIYW